MARKRAERAEAKIQAQMEFLLGPEDLREWRIRRHRRVWSGCTACQLKRTRERVVCGAGDSGATLFVVCDRTTRSDQRWVGPATGDKGRVLWRLLEKAGIDPETVFVSNATACNAGDETVTQAHRRACRPRLIEEISLVQPGIVVLMGESPAAQLFEGRETRTIRGLASRELPSVHSVRAVFVTHGIEASGRDKGLLQEILDDLRKIAKVVRALEKIPGGFRAKEAKK